MAAGRGRDRRPRFDKKTQCPPALPVRRRNTHLLCLRSVAVLPPNAGHRAVFPPATHTDARLSDLTPPNIADLIAYIESLK